MELELAGEAGTSDVHGISRTRLVGGIAPPFFVAATAESGNVTTTSGCRRIRSRVSNRSADPLWPSNAPRARAVAMSPSRARRALSHATFTAIQPSHAVEVNGTPYRCV